MTVLSLRHDDSALIEQSIIINRIMYFICLHTFLVAMCRRTWVEGEGEMGKLLLL